LSLEQSFTAFGDSEAYVHFEDRYGSHDNGRSVDRDDRSAVSFDPTKRLDPAVNCRKRRAELPACFAADQQQARRRKLAVVGRTNGSGEQLFELLHRRRRFAELPRRHG